MPARPPSNLMDKASIINFANSNGGYAFLRKFNGASSQETICINVGKHKTDFDIVIYRHGIFISERENGWVIGFSQFGKTRELSDTELRKILERWLSEPDDNLFSEYMET